MIGRLSLPFCVGASLWLATWSHPGNVRQPSLSVEVWLGPSGGRGSISPPGPGDFRLRVDSEPRSVIAVRPAPGPLAILLILDAGDQAIWRASLTPRPDARAALARVIERQFINRLDPADRVRIASFGARLGLSARYTTDRKELGAALLKALTLSKEDREGPSPIWDVVSDGLADVSGQPGRRAIVLYTDGEATANVGTPADVVLQAAARTV